MISKAFKTKTIKQIRKKVNYMLRQIKSDPKHKHAKIASVIKKISKHVLTDEKKKTFYKALQKHGKDYKKIREYFPTMSYRIIKGHV